MAHEGVVADLARLVALYDRHDVRGGDPRPPTDADLAAVDEVIGATNELLEQVRTLVGLPLHLHLDRRDRRRRGRHCAAGSRPSWPT